MWGPRRQSGFWCRTVDLDLGQEPVRRWGVGPKGSSFAQPVHDVQRGGASIGLHLGALEEDARCHGRAHGGQLQHLATLQHPNGPEIQWWACTVGQRAEGWWAWLQALGASLQHTGTLDHPALSLQCRAEGSRVGCVGCGPWEQDQLAWSSGTA